VYAHGLRAAARRTAAGASTDAVALDGGASSKGLPNGRPSTEWGIRHGAWLLQPLRRLGCPARGDDEPAGGSPTAIRQVGRVACAVRAARRGPTTTSHQSSAALAQGNVAPGRVLLVHGLHRRTCVAPIRTATTGGRPRAYRSGAWRRRPPQGPYWIEGMKLGNQDRVWTLFKSTPVDSPARPPGCTRSFTGVRRRPQLKKKPRWPEFVRDSDSPPRLVHERAPRLGGLVEFYAARDRRWSHDRESTWPDLPKLARSGGRTSATWNSGSSPRSRDGPTRQREWTR